MEVPSAESEGQAPIHGSCATDALTKLARETKDGLLSAVTGVSPADYTQDFESRCQRCQDALIQTDLSTTTITISTYIASVGLGKQPAAYTATRASQLIQGVNAAYARSGFQFKLVKYVDNFVFTSQGTLDGNDCFGRPANPNCQRCSTYRQIVPTSSQGSLSLVIYLSPYPTNTGNEVTLGASYLPQDVYNPSPTSNSVSISCIDGVYVVTTPANGPGGLASAVKQDVATVTHEVGQMCSLYVRGACNLLLQGAHIPMGAKLLP